MGRNRLLATGALLSLALLSWRAVNNDDTFMYMGVGGWIARHHAIPNVDHFSWTYPHQPFQSTAWLWGLVLWELHRAAGDAGIAAVKPVLIFVAGAGIVRAARAFGARGAAALAAAPLALLLVFPWVSDRPQMADYAMLPFVLLLAHRADPDGRVRLRWLLLLAFVVVVWVNLHGAALTSGAYVAALELGALCDRVRASGWQGPRRALGAAVAPAVVVVVSGVALLVNPWGWGMVTHAWAVSALSAATISEWYPLVRAGALAFLPVAVAVAAAVVVARSPRPLRLELLLPPLVGAALTVDAIRSAPSFVLTCAVCLPPLVRPLGPWMRARSELVPVAVGALLAFSLLAAVRFVPETGAPGTNIPVRAVAALPAGCKLRNASFLGGYVIATRPDVPVSADGRNDFYGLAGYAQNTWFSDPAAASRTGVSAIEVEGTDCVLARPSSPLVAALLDRGWRVAGRDPSGVSLVR